VYCNQRSISYLDLAAKPSRDVQKLARQQETWERWERRSGTGTVRFSGGVVRKLNVAIGRQRYGDWTSPVFLRWEDDTPPAIAELAEQFIADSLDSGHGI
jgi:hypothetical protein